MEALTGTELAERTRQVVSDKGLTQQAVADRLGITQSAVAQATNPSYEGVNGTRIRILEELGGSEVETGFIIHNE
jgi:predicted transcriptional regulator